MQIRPPEALREARRLRRSPRESGAPDFCRFPRLGEGRLARRKSWDREPPGWMLRLRPFWIGGLDDGI
eukprot:3834740-Alexandrium_andersonii.AAC.1